MQKSTFGIYHVSHKLTLLSADLMLTALAFFIASKIRLNISPDFFSIEYLSLSFIIIVSIFIGSGYTSNSLESAPKLPMNILLVVLCSAIPCTMFIYIMGPDRFIGLFGRTTFPSAIVLTGIFSVLSRYYLDRLFGKNDTLRRVLFIGDSETSDLLTKSFSDIPVHLTIDRVDRISSQPSNENCDAIVISPDYKANSEEQKLLLASRLSGTPIFSISDFFESFLFLIPVNKINNDWFIRAEGFTMLHSIVSIKLKRTADILLSSVLLVLSLPLLLISVVIIKLSSKGPAIFLQDRVGFQGRIFTIYKLRTMENNAEDGVAQWAASNDSRVFLYGRFLRKSRIDELPQCWNILKGDMSFVGPRPERPEFTSMLSDKIPYFDLRHLVKPGLTGWAQVSYPYGASVEDSLRKLQYDLYYIKNYSLLLDLNILLRTVLVSVRRVGR